MGKLSIASGSKEEKKTKEQYCYTIIKLKKKTISNRSNRNIKTNNKKINNFVNKVKINFLHNYLHHTRPPFFLVFLLHVASIQEFLSAHQR